MASFPVSDVITAQGRPNPAPVTVAPADRPIAIPIVLALNVATGAVEAICYAHLGHIFCAFITGTVILAGLHAGSGGIDLLKPYIFPVAGFICGGIIGGRLVKTRSDIGRTFARLINIEAAILAAAAVCVALFPIGVDTTGRFLALALLSLAMGLQFSATKYLNVTDLTLAALTGVIHGLIQDSHIARGQPQRTGRRIGAIVAIAAGATVGAAIATWSIAVSIGCAASLVAISALAAAVSFGAWGPRARSEVLDAAVGPATDETDRS